MTEFKITRQQAVWVEWVAYVDADNVEQVKAKLETGDVTLWLIAPDCAFEPVNEKDDPVDTIEQVN